MDLAKYRSRAGHEQPETVAHWYIADAPRALFEDSPEGEAAGVRIGLAVEAFRNRPFADRLAFYRVVQRYLRDLEQHGGTASLSAFRDLAEHFYCEVLG
ncbi:MAG: hypothetical protein HY520_04585 [Candidatus Aenigmarchaeota archaeon]|nr:hypothetical protein [Candidatus Aenigmarchaeota archaeon]